MLCADKTAVCKSDVFFFLTAGRSGFFSGWRPLKDISNASLNKSVMNIQMLISTTSHGKSLNKKNKLNIMNTNTRPLKHKAQKKLFPEG